MGASRVSGRGWSRQRGCWQQLPTTLGGFRAAFPERGGERKRSSLFQQLEAFGGLGSRRCWRRGLCGWDARQECRIQPGWLGRAGPARVCRAGSGNKARLPTLPPTSALAVPTHSTTQLRQGLLGPAPAPHGYTDTICLPGWVPAGHTPWRGGWRAAGGPQPRHAIAPRHGAWMGLAKPCHAPPAPSHQPAGL